MARGELAKLLGPREADVMHAVWDLDGAVTVRQICDRLNAGRDEPLAYTTVMTIASRLADKGALTRRTGAGRAYLYEAAAEDAAALAVRAVLRDFGGSAVARFVEETRGDPALLRRMEELLRADR